MRKVANRQRQDYTVVLSLGILYDLLFPKWRGFYIRATAFTSLNLHDWNEKEE